MAETEHPNSERGEEVSPSSIPAGFNVCVQGFENEDAARSMGQIVGDIIVELGRTIDLSRLDGVTIGVDYDAALTSIDRGMPNMRPLSRSDTEEMQGIAMSPAVLRDGEVRTHLVFSAEHLVPLIWQGEEVTDEDRRHTLGVIAHECAHVQVTAEKEIAIPECRLGTRIEGYERAVMFQIAEICWDEYAACRLSSPYAVGQNISHAATVIACSETAREQADNAIRSYRVHGDIDRLVEEAGPPICAPLKVLAYLLGGMDGEGTDWDGLPEVFAAIENAGYTELARDLHSELLRLWNTRGNWNPTLDTFSGIEEVAKSAFDTNGLYFKTDAAGNCRIDVPFTPHTMP